MLQYQDKENDAANGKMKIQAIKQGAIVARQNDKKLPKFNTPGGQQGTQTWNMLKELLFRVRIQSYSKNGIC